MPCKFDNLLEQQVCVILLMPVYIERQYVSDLQFIEGIKQV